MADVAPEETDEDRRIRLRQEEMERLLLDQETQQDTAVYDPMQPELNERNENDNNNNIVNNDNNIGIEGAAVVEGAAVMAAPAMTVGGFFRQKLSYTTCSFIAALATIVYALRSRDGQWYLALVYLSSSKWAFCVLGNALVALAIQTFSVTTKLFLQGGLRLHEAEGLQDFFRWNVTETCLALTMFRSELTVGTACEFLCLIVAKCLHHVAVMRQEHLRMTDDAVQPSTFHPNLPSIPWHHVRVLIFLVLLQLFDLWALQYTAQILLTTGPSVSILFAFEAAILLVSAWSHLLLWHLHVLDGLLHFCHELGSAWGRKWLHTWKEHKATLTFAVELQAQAVQFVFYLCFFGFVLTYYGVPINLFREVYISFSALKERLVAFFKYRRLMAGMNRFSNPTEEQLEEAGRICIICRDEMTVHDSKQLPVCQHLFHKSCLREWLTQQQSCPTCRSDIAAMQAQETSRNAAAQAAAQRVEEEEENETTEQQQNESEDGDGASVEPQRVDGVSGNTETEASSEQPPPSTVSRDAGAPTAVDGLRERLDKSTDDSNNTKSLGRPPISHTNGTASSPSLGPGPSSDMSESSWCDLPTTAGDAASPQQQPKGGKAVRFAESVAGRSQPMLSRFPALYRVVRGTGATVWHFEEENDGTQQLSNEEAQPFPVRMIPLSVVVLGEKEETKSVAGLGATGLSTGTFVRIPDGWVAEDEVLRIYTMD